MALADSFHLFADLHGLLDVLRRAVLDQLEIADDFALHLVGLRVELLELAQQFALALEGVSFYSNAMPALASEGLVLVQNTDGLSASDIVNVTVGDCGNPALTQHFCFFL